MARPVTKFAKASSKQLRQLHELYQSHRLPSHRRRAHAMILSNQGYCPAEVAEILDADADTVRRWIDRFNAQGCAGLVDQPRPGGPPKLDDTEQEVFRGLVDTYPDQPHQVISELKQRTGKTINTQTVIEVIDHFASHIRHPTTLVLDNSRVHTSAKFNARLDRWKERELTIFRLPTYSPELNVIEGFWRKLKYQWMPADAWDKFNDLLYNAVRCVEQHGIPYLMPSLQN